MRYVIQWFLQHPTTHCNTLQYTATHCNTLQHTATHCNIHVTIGTHVQKKYQRFESSVAKKPCHTYVFVIEHMCIRQWIHMYSCSSMCAMTHRPVKIFVFVVSHISLRHVPSCHTYTFVMLSHLTHMYTSMKTYIFVISNIFIRHAQSWHAYRFVMLSHLTHMQFEDTYVNENTHLGGRRGVVVLLAPPV